MKRVLLVSFWVFIFVLAGCGGGGANSSPIANAGPDQNVLTGSTVSLDGSGSADADGNELTYCWAFITKPNGSSAVLSDVNSVSPTFYPDISGTYEISLKVNDGMVDSQIDSLEVTVTYLEIIVYGDSRTQDNIHQEVVNNILEKSPDIVFHTGDLVGDGRIESQWDTFNTITSQLRTVAEFYPLSGNHENESSLYYDNFTLPNNEKWYSVERNNIHFVIINSNLNMAIDSEQFLWLKNDLQSIKSTIRFTVVLFHHPPFTTGPHIEDEKGFKNAVVPLFEQYGVDLVFSGHNHNYERSFYNNIYYIVSGGGGAPLYNQSRSSIYSQVFDSSYHFCKINLIGARLIVSVYNLSSDLIDEFQIN